METIAAPTFANSDEPSPASGNSSGIAVAVLAAAVLIGFSASRWSAHTALITPISPVGLLAARIVGLALGLAVAIVTLRGRGLALTRQVILMVVIPVGGYAVGDGIAWRVADHWHFSGSQVEWSRARYPVVNVKGGGKSHNYSLGIDPFQTGEPAEISIPHAQYEALRDAFEGQCVTVLQRRSADGAVEIDTRRGASASLALAEVAPCNQPVNASPWH